MVSFPTRFHFPLSQLSISRFFSRPPTTQKRTNFSLFINNFLPPFFSPSFFPLHSNRQTRSQPPKEKKTPQPSKATSDTHTHTPPKIKSQKKQPPSKQPKPLPTSILIPSSSSLLSFSKKGRSLLAVTPPTYIPSLTLPSPNVLLHTVLHSPSFPGFWW